MTLSEFSIRRPVFAWMLMSALIIFGAISFARMGVSQLPDVDFPVVNVAITLVGAAPEVMETQVVDPIEDAVMGIEGVRTVTSKSFEGVATIVIEFELTRDIEAALNDVQTKVVQAEQLLPKDIDPPVITKINPDDQPILWLAVSSDTRTLRELTLYVRDQLKNEFSTISGVGDIILGGYIEPNMRVWVSQRDLSRYALTVSDVMDTIRNQSLEPPSGFLEMGKRESNVRTLGEIRTPQELASVTINTRGNQPNYVPIPISKIAQVEAGLADIRRISRASGKPAVGLGIRKQRGANAVAVARAVKAKIARVEKNLPQGMKLTINFDGTRFIEEAISELNFTLVLSALLTGIVCWLFLGSWSSTLNVLLAIPTSIVGSFIFLYFSGFTLNTFTLLGLSLAIGIVVDDAIMVLENIVRHGERGESRVDAAILGSREITFAALAATVAIIAIFLPVAFMKGIIGRFFFQYGVTITVAVSLSLVEALTLTPMRSALFVSAAERKTRLGNWIDRGFKGLRTLYAGLLETTLRHPWKTILGAMVFFVVSFLVVVVLRKEFAPPQDQSIFLMKLETPVGSSLDYTSRKFNEAESFLSDSPEISRYFAIVGGFTGGEINSGFIFVTMKSPKERTLTQQQFMDLARKKLNAIPDLKATLQDLSLSGFTAGRSFPVEFTITGPDFEKLVDYSMRIMDEMKKSGLVRDVDTDAQVGKPEIRIRPDRDKAAARAVDIGTVAQAISTLIGGEVAGKYSEGGHRYDIRVKLVQEERDEPTQLRKITVRNHHGELISVADLVQFSHGKTLQSISRRDRQRSVTISANLAPGKSLSDALDSSTAIARKVLPSGYAVVESGSAETFRESFNSLFLAMILGIIISYMVLGSQFNSFLDPFSVLLALPFSISGAFIALWIGAQSINIYSLIGLILLMGIAKKNSILLVDFTNQIKNREGKGVMSALLEACPIRLERISD